MFVGQPLSPRATEAEADFLGATVTGSPEVAHLSISGENCLLCFTCFRSHVQTHLGVKPDTSLAQPFSQATNPFSSFLSHLQSTVCLFGRKVLKVFEFICLYVRCRGNGIRVLTDMCAIDLWLFVRILLQDLWEGRKPFIKATSPQRLRLPNAPHLCVSTLCAKGKKKKGEQLVVRRLEHESSATKMASD